MTLKIHQFLSALPGNTTYHYLPNPGNAGDSLIAWATYRLFDETGLHYRVVDGRDFNPEGKTLIYGGGGNLVPEWGSARRTLKACYPFLKRLIILPHTIRGNRNLLETFGSNVDIVCREMVSFDYVTKTVSAPNVLLMDDLAFSLDPHALLRFSPLLSGELFRAIFFRKTGSEGHHFYVSLKKVSKKTWNKKLVYRGVPRGGKILNCFRMDREKTGLEIPRDNLDISSLFGYGTENRLFAGYAGYRLVNFISKYEEIRTNRLHVAIAAAGLGKSVKLYPNSYYKCEAVYRYSMEHRFPNVRWMG